MREISFSDFSPAPGSLYVCTFDKLSNELAWILDMTDTTNRTWRRLRPGDIVFVLDVEYFNTRKNINIVVPTLSLKGVIYYEDLEFCVNEGRMRALA